MSDGLNDRRKELEEAFFAKQNEAHLAKLKAEKQKSLDKAGITEITGITNDEVLEKLLAMKMDRETVAALSLFPLIDVAWADGAVDDKERAAVLKAAEASGLLNGSAAHNLLEGWLKLKPAAALHSTWANYVKAMVEGMKPDDKTLLKNELLGKARAVAEASGGILGMGAKISKSEADALKKLEDAFK